MRSQSISCPARLALTVAALAVFGCSKPAQPPSPQPSPGATQAKPAEYADQPLSTLAVGILNKAHRSGSVILGGQCSLHSIDDPYKLPRTATLEPMEPALQEVSAKFQNIYWRESPATGVRVA